MLTAAKVLACTAIDLYEAPEALAEARAEFERRSKSGYVCPIEPGAKPIAI
jgi:aminobenzoyl-glutamate utilization protein B